MARPIRDTDPRSYRLITIRTDESRLWMVPSGKMEKLLGGIIARYQETLGVLIFAYVFLSNHYHLIIQAPLGNADEFEENINREIARRVNWKRGRQGRFWKRRYDDQKILSENDLLEAFLYVTTNALNHGLVPTPAKWTGLSSYEQCLTEEPKLYTFQHHSAPEGQPATTQHSLVISPLPQFSSLSKEERAAKITKLIRNRTRKIIRDRRVAGLGFLGIQNVLSQDPSSQPKQSSQSRRPPCYTKDAALRREYRLSRRLRRAKYSEASMRYRGGVLTAEFPIYSFKPPLHRKPRLSRFNPLPDGYFANVVAA